MPTFWNAIPGRKSSRQRPSSIRSGTKLFTYAGLDLLLKRYVIRSHHGAPLETPQEMYLGIALHLAMEEKENPHGLGKAVL